MSTLILCYHRVNEGVEDPFGLCVSPRRFAQHLKWMARKARVVTLEEAMVPADDNRVVVTFDDGYADNLLYAAPIAQRLGVPMTVYVTSGMVGDSLGFWWDRLARLVLHGSDHPVEVRVRIGTETIAVPMGDSSQAPRVIADLRNRLCPCSVDEIDRVLTSLGETLGIHPAAPADARPLTLDELHRMSKFDNVTVGAHTTRHVQLRDQPADAQAETVSRSKQDLETALGAPVRHFAYPFGGRDSFDDTSVAAVRQAGLITATTTIPGSVGPSPDPWRLRRRVVMDWPAWRFHAQMTYWGLF